MIDAKEINEMLYQSFFTKEEIENGGDPKPGEFVSVPGIIQHFGFHPVRVKEHRARLLEIIKDLDPKFFPDTGGGWTFLNLPFDKDGVHWGQHPDCEALIALCIANDLCKYLLPRDVWPDLPGGVPYVVFGEGVCL